MLPREPKHIVPWFPSGFSRRAALEIANASTVSLLKLGIRLLPYGYVQSPALASLALDKSCLGNRLRFVKKQGLVVSVYVDDMILSGDSKYQVECAVSSLLAAANAGAFQMLSQPVCEGTITEVLGLRLIASDLEIAPRQFERMKQAFACARSEAQREGISRYVRQVCKIQHQILIGGAPD